MHFNGLLFPAPSLPLLWLPGDQLRIVLQLMNAREKMLHFLVHEKHRPTESLSNASNDTNDRISSVAFSGPPAAVIGVFPGPCLPGSRHLRSEENIRLSDQRRFLDITPSLDSNFFLENTKEKTLIATSTLDSPSIRKSTTWKHFRHYVDNIYTHVDRHQRAEPRGWNTSGSPLFVAPRSCVTMTR